MTAKSVFIISELYYPDETATGYLLTKIAEGLAKTYHVQVICGHGNSNQIGNRSPDSGNRNGVLIHRCSGTKLNKDILLFRIINLVTVSISIFLKTLKHVSKGGLVLVVTNPPSLPFVISIACKMNGAKCYLLIHDVYPDVLVATGIMEANDVVTRVLKWLNSLLYRSVDRIIVLGRDMKRLVEQRIKDGDQRVKIITNWADTEEIWPTPRQENELRCRLGLESQFVVQYAGNMGRTHGLETIVHAAQLLKQDQRIHFLFLGSGAKKKWLEAELHRQGLMNGTVLPSLPRSQQQVFLNACDVAIVSFIPGMAGISVPSRMYNIMAAGKPIIAVADEDSELSMVIREENVGWVVEPNNPTLLKDTISAAMRDPLGLAEKQENASRLANEKYRFGHIIQSYSKMFHST